MVDGELIDFGVIFSEVFSSSLLTSWKNVNYYTYTKTTSLSSVLILITILGVVVNRRLKEKRMMEVTTKIDG